MKDNTKTLPTNFKEALSELEDSIKDELDADFSIAVNKIDTVEEFEQHILTPYKNGEKVFYRGERCYSADRKLIPTLFRHPEYVFKTNQQPISVVDCKHINSIYEKMGNFKNVYDQVFLDKAKKSKQYRLFAFAQHYLDVSPFIDFTKSPYVALSFALKDRSEYPDDIVIYKVEIENESCFTNEATIAEKWVQDFNVTVSRPIDRRKITASDRIKTIKALGKADLQSLREEFETMEKIRFNNSPSAKMIDVPINDLMKYQQGVFLMLSDFNLFYKSYYTKNIRKEFKIKKYIISKDICPNLFEILLRDAEHYQYKYLTNIREAFVDFKLDYNRSYNDN